MAFKFRLCFAAIVTLVVTSVSEGQSDGLEQLRKREILSDVDNDHGLRPESSEYVTQGESPPLTTWEDSSLTEGARPQTYTSETISLNPSNGTGTTTTTPTSATIITTSTTTTTIATTSTTTLTPSPIHPVSVLIIEPFDSDTKSFYNGEYHLTNATQKGHPKYKKDDSDIVNLFVSERDNSWVFADEDGKDYIFKLDPSNPVANAYTPADWDDSIWNKSWLWSLDGNETLTLKLKPKEKTFFPPLTFVLAPHEVDDEPLYAGKYSLDCYKRFPETKDGMPQYSKEHKAGEANITLYVSPTRDQWVMGNNEHMNGLP